LRADHIARLGIQTMDMTEFLNPGAVFSGVKTSSKKQLLQFMSERRRN
jgi:hypothetical protein